MLSSRNPTAQRSDEDEMRAALQVAVAQICTAETSDGAQMTKSAISTLAELTYLYATTSLANDLEAFSIHAGRRTITSEDVQLVARKNPDNLLSKLREFGASISNTTTATVTATAAATGVTAVIASTSAPMKKKTSPSTKKKNMSPTPKNKMAKFPRSQRNRELREDLLRRIDTDLENSDSMHKQQHHKPAAKSVWDFSQTDDEEDEDIKEHRKPAAKRKARTTLDISSSSSEDAPSLSQMKRKKDNCTMEDRSKINIWSSDDDEDSMQS